MINVGDRVRCFGEEGVVQEINEDYALVVFDRLGETVYLSDCVRVDADARKIAIAELVIERAQLRGAIDGCPSYALADIDQRIAALVREML